MTRQAAAAAKFRCGGWQVYIQSSPGQVEGWKKIKKKIVGRREGLERKTSRKVEVETRNWWCLSAVAEMGG
jgi:hypothetical protein